jgi:hypothetical protein
MSSAICSPSCSSMYSRIISSVMVPKLTARYPLAQKCFPQNFLRNWGNSCSSTRELIPLQPLHHLADLLVRPIRNKQVNMVACDFAGNDLQFMLHGDLAEKVARDHVTPNLASPEGEGFPPSPMGTLTIGNGASPGSDGNHQPLRWKMTRRPSNANYHQTVKDRPTGGRLRGHKEVPSQVPDDSGRIVSNPYVTGLGKVCS